MLAVLLYTNVSRRLERLERNINMRKFLSSVYVKMLLPSLCFFLVTFFTDGTYQNLSGYTLWTFLYMFIMNVFPLYILMLLFYFISNRVWIGSAITAFLSALLHAINRYKVIFRDEPLKLFDLKVAKEAGNIVQNYSLTFQASLAVMIGLFLVISVLVCVIEKRGGFRRTPYTPKKKEVLIRICGALLSVVLLFSGYRFIYQSDGLISDIIGTKELESPVVKQQHAGMLLYLLSSSYVTEYPTPDGYRKEDARALLSSFEEETDTDKVYPNVIAIMSEAFFDPTDGENTKFYPDKDPLLNFNRLKENAIYGNIIVPGFGGGTADTEFEFLTGSNASVIDAERPPIFNTYLSHKLFSLPWLYKDFGFETHGIHPGHRWFYNRGDVYGWLGFDDFLTKESLPSDLEKTNYYINDSETEKLIRESYDTYLSSGNKSGYFSFTVTIQNHGPYMEKATEREPALMREAVSCDEKLYHVLDNYMAGLSDADRMLGNLSDYINTKDVPTVIVFFGDHLPYFGADGEGFRALGIDIDPEKPESALRKQSTPFLIFGNDAFHTWEKENGFSAKQGKVQDISASFLGNELLSYTHTPKPAFFKYTDTLKKELPVILANTFVVDQNGTFSVTPSEEVQKLLDEYRKLICYNTLDWQNEK